MDFNDKKWQLAQAAKNAFLNRKSLFFLSDLGTLSPRDLSSDNIPSNTAINSNLGMTLLGALLRLLSRLRPNANQNVSSKRKSNDKNICKHKTLLAEKYQIHGYIDIVCLKEAKKQVCQRDNQQA